MMADLVMQGKNMNTTDKDIQLLEEMRDEEDAKRRPYRHMPGSSATVLWENSTRRITALTNILGDFKDMREMLEAVSHLEWDAEAVGMGDSSVFGIYRESDGTFEASVDGLLIGRGNSVLDAWREVKKEGRDAAPYTQEGQDG